MKVIINIQTPSFYTKFNFLTFEVHEIGNTWVSIKGLNPELPLNQTDFTFSEVFIVDIEKEMQMARENSDWSGGEATRKFESLKKYCEFRKIKDKTFFVPAQ
ncbi:hypothetical protein SAMN05880574_1544 [Chryseobacterium sp. RU37D]|uniref:hypothetical protein n=1 Tax=Chryseobacterium sp. RU37D TaxID=1907397 RepID=UPI000956DED0|nr:hypothetical protein [Chryseobacterium sp. RU37D]SIR01945.1 hypothetical protein SAMN05880574_1544 [Chryseobacterium sp. RU37D]